MDKLISWFNANVGSDGTSLEWYWRVSIILGVFLAAYLVDFLFAKAIIPALRKITSKTDTEMDDVLLSDKVVRAFSNIIPPIILTFALPFVTQGDLEQIVRRLTDIYIIINVTRFLCILVNALFQAILLRGKEKGKNQSRMHSMKGLVQTIQIFICAIASILVVSRFLDKSPTYLISGLGAMAAVLMLVFQDSIKGLVAGIQLMFNDMLEVGDWICMPSRNVDGVVLEINLTIIKVQNWDNTILTIPTCNMLTETFQNWRGMQQSEGRRLCRNINVDMHSVCFVTPAMAKRWNVSLQEGESMTNLQLFRSRLFDYLQHHKAINPKMTLMVRQLTAGSEGIPVQIYAFTHTKVWEEYEEIQARLIEYALCMMREYGLRPYQRGSDFRQNVSVVDNA